MNRILKTLLLWILIAALPVQGLAAASNASCGPAHHVSAAAAAVADQHHGDASIHHHDGGMHAAGHVAAADTVEAPSAAGDHGYCSACAACCIGATGPPPALTLVISDRCSEAIAIFAPPAFAGHIPAGLERPPRILPV